MAGLTLVQKQTLNDVSKYEPAWRNFGLLTGQGFGDIIDDTIERVDSLETTSSASFLEFNISFNSPNEIILLSGASEVFISEVVVQILQPFNSLAELSIGTDSDPDLIVPIIESDLNELIEFISNPKIKTSDQIKLFLNSGSSSQGQAKVIIKF